MPEHKNLIIISTNSTSVRLISEFLKIHGDDYKNIVQLRHTDAARYFEFSSLSYRSLIKFFYSIIRFYLYQWKSTKSLNFLNSGKFDVIIPFAHYDLNFYLINHVLCENVYFVEEGDVAYLTHPNFSLSMEQRWKFKNKGLSGSFYKWVGLGKILGFGELFPVPDENIIRVISSNKKAFGHLLPTENYTFDLSVINFKPQNIILFLIDDMYRLDTLCFNTFMKHVELRLRFAMKKFKYKIFISTHPSVRSDKVLSENLNSLLNKYSVNASFVNGDTLEWIEQANPAVVIGSVSSLLRYASRIGTVKVYSDIGIIDWRKEYKPTSINLAKSYADEGVNLLTKGQLSCAE